MLFGAERRLALTLQRSLLPTALPELPGIELAARYLPGAGGRDVGGDFYLAHALEDGRLLLVIGDVMGHGPQAAARMGQLRAVLAAYAYDGDPPDRVLAHVSRARDGAAGPADGDRPGRRSTTRRRAAARSRSPATCRRWSRRSTATPAFVDARARPAAGHAA